MSFKILGLTYLYILFCAHLNYLACNLYLRSDQHLPKYHNYISLRDNIILARNLYLYVIPSTFYLYYNFLRERMISIFPIIVTVIFNFHGSSTVFAKIDCDEDLINKIAKWANTLPVLVKQDERRLKNLRRFEEMDDIDQLRDYYYRTVSETIQTKCSFIKRIGG